MKQIKQFTEELEANPLEMINDFSRIHNISVFDIGDKVDWTYAWYLYLGLLQNPQSSLAAKKAGYARPFSHMEIALTDFIDIFKAAHTSSKGKFKPYPRGWHAPKIIGKGSLPMTKALAFFAKLGHKPKTN